MSIKNISVFCGAHLGNNPIYASEAQKVAEVMCSNQLGIINKPIGILNTNGYYDHLLAWMKKAVEEGFVSDANFNELIVSDSCEDLIERVASEKRPADDDWTNRLGL